MMYDNVKNGIIKAANFICFMLQMYTIVDLIGGNMPQPLVIAGWIVFGLGMCIVLHDMVIELIYIRRVDDRPDLWLMNESLEIGIILHLMFFMIISVPILIIQARMDDKSEKS